MDTSIRGQMLAAYKNNFCELLRETGRERIEDLIAWLEDKTDFFWAPASAKHMEHMKEGCSFIVYQYTRYCRTSPRIFPV